VNGHSSAHVDFRVPDYSTKTILRGTEYCTPTPVFLAARKPSEHKYAPIISSVFQVGKLPH
jgi:hypothetical protein